MAVTIRLAVHGIAETRRDLEAVETGIGRVLTVALKEASATVATRTEALTPKGPGPQSPKDNLPHISSTIRGVAAATTAGVVSSHPGAQVLEYGGTISPKGHPITFRENAMAHRAGDELAHTIERRLQEQIDRLLKQHNLT